MLQGSSCLVCMLTDKWCLLWASTCKGRASTCKGQAVSSTAVQHHPSCVAVLPIALLLQIMSILASMHHESGLTLCPAFTECKLTLESLLACKNSSLSICIYVPTYWAMRLSICLVPSTALYVGLPVCFVVCLSVLLDLGSHHLGHLPLRFCMLLLIYEKCLVSRRCRPGASSYL